MTGPLISLVTIVRNGAVMIERALASTDGMQAVIERYRDCVRFARSEKGAPYDTTLQGYRRATGDLVGLLIDWLCFNAPRAAYFRLKNGELIKAIHAMDIATRASMGQMLKRCVFYRMPRAYRPKKPGGQAS